MVNFGKVRLIIYKGKVVNNVVLKEERKKKKMIEIINNLLLCLELEGDGGFTSFTAKEKDDMYNYLISLKTQEENKTKHSIKCYNCKQIVDYPTVDDRLSNEVLKSSDRLKQEVNNEQV